MLESRFVMRTFAIMWAISLVLFLVSRVWGDTLPDQKTVADYLRDHVHTKCGLTLSTAGSYATSLRTVCQRQHHLSDPTHHWQNEADILVDTICATAGGH